MAGTWRNINISGVIRVEDEDVNLERQDSRADRSLNPKRLCGICCLHTNPPGLTPTSSSLQPPPGETTIKLQAANS